MEKINRIRINVGSGYDVAVGEGLLKECGGMIGAVTGLCKAAVITDTNVAPLYLGTALRSLEQAGFSACSYTFEAGEQSKNITVFGQVLEFLAQNRLTRGDIVVSLGGGVVGDMSGFAAACYMRGIRFVQMPTTLLAAVDSSVGGKTAIDLEGGKNLAGAFHQPSLVVCDTSCLNTLSPHFFADGISEAVKTAILDGGKLLSIMENGAETGSIREIIIRCVSYKGRIVEADEKEAGLRRLLNLGHTVGHAIEKCSGFSISHGHAVAMGTAIISRSSARLGHCTAELAKRIESALINNNLPVASGFTPEQLAQAALLDKKRRSDSIAMIMPFSPGDCRVVDVPVEKLEATIALGMEPVGRVTREG